MAPTNTCSHCVTRGHLVLLHQVLVSFVLCPENLRLYKTGFCFFLAGLTLWVCHFPLCPSEGAISSCPSVPAPSPAPGVVAGAPETAVHRVARGALSTAANLWWVGRAPSCTAPYPAQPHIPHSPVSHTAPYPAQPHAPGASSSSGSTPNSAPVSVQTSGSCLALLRAKGPLLPKASSFPWSLP